MSLTYWSYLKLDQLLDLQEPASDEHDEQLFIIIHQVYELWFKLMLHELDKAGRDLDHSDLFGAIHTFKRARTILKTLVAQLDILETMTPISFTSFRDRLSTASGFQSAQYRELEFVLGYKRAKMLNYYKEDSPRYNEMQRRLSEPSLVDRFSAFVLKEAGQPDHELATPAPSTAPAEPHKDVQDALLKLYYDRPNFAILFELMTDFDEGLQEFRYRHVKIAERTIGQKVGTGGSLGVEFLKTSLFKPVFPDLWEIRNRM